MGVPKDARVRSQNGVMARKRVGFQEGRGKRADKSESSRDREQRDDSRERGEETREDEKWEREEQIEKSAEIRRSVRQ